ncbi:hypothetical protein [Gordonia westfalica]|uniref:DUF1508 domain-containing protein n=1 Tax=Gordonia westfalica TaxID=158898 RepID=A0A1H2DNR5_9ACTN|nr:hypothetical protein [Gordonia westfalica]SDT83686.1 hypothetical protein SAMN04488548_1016 [Gordonia westfalica]SDT83701.1 hypothetical protein SAMN04488548_10121 [Gordonia westfalica]SDT83732.1 hypothetical protein SAMN04488548_10152 [Gordonia westfalica]SDT84527.1 hypothetical protein SAMN04488548_10941 [Gordonia westfalica]SDT84542.1 hypothetical protein SAMN04488548_10946 [Gordonia westfalica]
MSNNKKAFDGEAFKAVEVVKVQAVGGGSGGNGGYVVQPLASARTAVRVVVTRTRKGYQWAQIARNGSAGAISPKTYDTKSNAVRAAKRQAALVGGVVEVQ